MLVYFIYSILLFILSVGCFVIQRKDLLMVLLSLEMVVLSTFLMLFLGLSEFYNEISFSSNF